MLYCVLLPLRVDQISKTALMKCACSLQLQHSTFYAVQVYRPPSHLVLVSAASSQQTCIAISATPAWLTQ